MSDAGSRTAAPIKVAFDHAAFCMQKYGGVSRYFCSIGSALPGVGVQPRFFAPFHRNEYLRSEPVLDSVGPWLPGYPPRTARVFMAASKHVSRLLIRRWRPDVLHRTYYDESPATRWRLPNVVTVYDMILERFSESPSRVSAETERKRRAVESADHILAISHHTSRDLQEMWQVDPSRITVTHLAPYSAASSSDPSQDSGRSIPAQPFLLYVGRRGGYKNFEALLKAVAQNERLRKTFVIVAFGGSPFSQSEKAMFQTLGLDPDRLLQVSGSDGTLAAFYERASIFVYPSLYEGFGIPPLEAMSHGCPVCVSNTSSLPEVVGEAGQYFDPSEPGDIAMAIEQVAFDSAKRERLIGLGHEQAKAFTWARCAEQTAAVYRSLLQR